LHAPAGSLVVMDRGIATEENLAWCKAHGYRYVVVARAGVRQFDPHQAIEINAAGGQKIGLQKVLSADRQELRLYCHSPGREQKEAAIVACLAKRFEEGLQKLATGLAKPRGEKRLLKITERIGRLKENCHGIGQHYRIEYQTDSTGKKAQTLSWTKQPVAGTQMSDPGVYCQRSNETSWTPQQLWRTYVMLTDLEAVFRSLKSELGLRPIFHQKEACSDGHLFISVLAYQFVQIIRSRLTEQGIHDSWASLRKIFQVQRRVTSSFKTREGRTLNVRKASLPEPQLAQLYQALSLDLNPGGTKKLIV
jgi:hypothetical protein